MHESTRLASNKDMLLAALIFNIALLNTFSLSVVTNTKDAAMFSYGWTFRLGSKDKGSDMVSAMDTISNMYTGNRNSERPALGTMLDRIFEVAKCNPLSYDGGLQWRPEEISPTCNCLRNMHVEYVKSVNPAGLGLNITEMANTDTVTKTKVVVAAIKKKCFSAIRHTQVEDMYDPMLPDTANTLLMTNVVANVLYWNVMGCMFSFFIFLFDGVLRMDDTKDDMATILGYKEFTQTTNMVIGLVVAILIGWNLFIPFTFITPLYAVGILAMSIFFAVYSMYHVKREWDDIQVKNSYLPRKRHIFWIAYALTVPFVAISMDMLLQRRDWILNWTVFFSVLVVGLCSLGIEMLQSSFEHTVMNRNKRVQGASDVQRTKNSQDMGILCRRKNTVIRIIMVCTGIIVLTACVATFATFPSTPFSNSYMAVILVAFVLTLPLISSGRHLTERLKNLTGIEQAQHESTKSVSATFWDVWSIELGSMEIAARCIFTLAVLCDIWSIKMVDNMNIGL